MKSKQIGISHEEKLRLDISQLFWEVDEFCEAFEDHCSYALKLGSGEPPLSYHSCLSISEATTIVIAFHGLSDSFSGPNPQSHKGKELKKWIA